MHLEYVHHVLLLRSIQNYAVETPTHIVPQRSLIVHILSYNSFMLLSFLYRADDTRLHDNEKHS